MSKRFTPILAILKRRSVPVYAILASTIAGAVSYVVVTPPTYETKALLLLDDKSTSVSELGTTLSKLPENVAGGPSPIATQAELVKSQRVLQKAVAQLSIERPDTRSKKDLKLEAIKKNLTVTIVPATNILELTYRGHDPELTAQVLNAITETMVQESGESIRQKAKSVRIFLQKEVPLQQEQLEQAEREEAQYRSISGAVSPTEQTQSLVTSLSSLADQERTLAAQVQEAQVKENSLRQITEASSLKDAYAAVRIGQDAELKSLHSRLEDLEAKVVDARSRFRDQHPALLALMQQRDSIRQRYTQSITQLLSPNQSPPPTSIVARDTLSQDLISKLIVGEVERLALEQRLAAVRADLNRLQPRLNQIPAQLRPLAALTRRREDASAALKLLQGKLREAQIAEAQMVSNVQILELAKVPDVAKWPSRSAVLLLATVFGLILSVTVVLVMELLDDVLHDSTEIEGLLGFPFLGALPDLPDASLNVASYEEFLDNTGLIEPYRMVLNAIEAQRTDGSQSIVVSSTVMGEGTSVVVSHLAAVSALLSRKTLVIDLHLHDPTQHHVFSLMSQPGVVDVIRGRLSLHKATQATAINHLSILTCGELVNRPIQIIESAALQALLTEARRNYDLVILDTAPLESSSDLIALSAHCDGMLLVTRPGFTLRNRLTEVAAHLARTKLPVYGFVTNQVSPSTRGDYSHRSEQRWPPSHTPISAVHFDSPIQKLALKLRSMI